MKLQIVEVTPTIAKEWLRHNTLNRPIRKRYVESMADSMKRGEWAVTHQPVALNGNRLLDGQHRLLAVIESGLQSVKMAVIKDADPDTFDTIDIGARRSHSDIFREDMHVMLPISLVARLVYGGVATPREVAPIHAKLQKPMRELVSLYVRSTKKFTAAPIKVAALGAILHGERKTYVHQLFKDICAFNVTKLPPVAQSFVKQVSLSSEGRGIKVHSAQRDSLLVRAWTTFHEANSELAQLRVKDAANRMEEIRKVYRAALNIKVRDNAQ